MQLRFESSVFKYLKDVVIGILVRVLSVVLYWLDNGKISFKIKDNKGLIVAADKWYDKSTCLISAYSTIDGLKIKLFVVSTKTWRFSV